MSATSVYHNTGTCSWSLQPNGVRMHTTGSSHHHYQFWSLTVRYGGATKDNNNPCTHCKHPPTATSCWCCGHWWPKSKRYCNVPDSSITMCLYTWCLAPLDLKQVRLLDHKLHHNPTCRWKSSVTKVGPQLLKEITSLNIQTPTASDQEELGKHDSIKWNTVKPSYSSKEMQIQESSDSLKLIVLTTLQKQQKQF